MSPRLGILGGTFDPVHDGHLVAAQETAWALDLDRVLFVPAPNPPHKRDEPVTDAAHRVAMVRLAVQGNPAFEVSLLEVERGGLSYTVDTLRELGVRHPGQDLYFIVGMDSLADLPAWHDPAGIVRLARIAAVYRAGWGVVDLKALEAAVPSAAERVRIVPIPGLDISSTDLRRRLAAGRPIRYLVPDSVIAYIQEHGLYRD